MSTLHVAPDAHGDPTIWLGDLDANPTAVVTRHQIGGDAFDALSALIAPEPAPGATNSTDGGTGTVALDLDALRAVAEAATSGPWRWSVTGTELRAPSPHNGIALVNAFSTGAGGPDATHIAAFDPPTVLALIERAEKVECDQAAFDHNVARIEDLKATLSMVADRVDEFTYDEVSSILDDDPCDQWGEGYRSRLATAEAELMRLREGLEALADEWLPRKLAHFQVTASHVTNDDWDALGDAILGRLRALLGRGEGL